jgi:hypothetical protein
LIQHVFYKTTPKTDPKTDPKSDRFASSVKTTIPSKRHVLIFPIPSDSRPGT